MQPDGSFGDRNVRRIYRLYRGYLFNGWAVKRTPNATKLDRRSIGSVPRLLGKSQPNPRMFNTRTRKEAKGDAGGHRSVGSQNGQRGKCSDA